MTGSADNAQEQRRSEGCILENRLEMGCSMKLDDVSDHIWGMNKDVGQ